MSISRREFVQGAIMAAAVSASPGFGFSQQDPSRNRLGNQLWYAAPAQRWLEALPLGNGRMGAMVFGGVRQERIALSESTVWSGAPSSTDVNPNALSRLKEIRDLMFQGKYHEAEALCQQDLLGRPRSFGTNLPLADLEITFDADETTTHYRRDLDMDEGIAHVEYLSGASRFSREIFASNPDDVILVRLTCSAPHGLSCSVTLRNQVPGTLAAAGQNTLVFRGHAFEKKHSDGQHGVEVETRIRAIAEAGSVSCDGSRFRIQRANAVTLVIAIATDFRGAAPAQKCGEAIERAVTRGYARIRAAHVADHQALFRRVHFDLGSQPGPSDTPIDVRRKALEKGANDPALCALFFQYGRYLTIAGSRESSPLPLALQGIWNDGLASSMGWTDDFHLDINTQQNYWAAEVCNLSECQTPLFNFIEGLRQFGSTTAKSMYGAPGWVTHTVTNPWGYTAPGGGLGWGLFPTAGAWIALQMWEHYRFTGDTAFLRKSLYPVYRDAAAFFLSYLVEHPEHKWLVTGPSVSPENWFITPSGGRCSESMGPTCDRVLVYALFSACIEASLVLNVDEDLRGKLERARASLPPFQIGRHGQLQEWLEDFQEAIPNHRHTSHLLSLYPENQISLDATPALARAAEVTIERRLASPDWEATEWGRGNFMGYYARLRKGDQAHQHLIGLLTNAADDNLLTYSQAGVAGAADNIFAIDGNTSGSAGIAEMLLQSQGPEIHLLPALPSAWPDGQVKGLCARGGFQVEMRWSEGKLRSAALTHPSGASCTVRYGGKTLKVNVPARRAVQLSLESLTAA
jgi:alpha-L-fucosidase 2